MRVSVNKFKEIRKAGYKKKDIIKKERAQARYFDYLHKWALSLDAVNPLSPNLFTGVSLSHEEIMKLPAAQKKKTLLLLNPDLKLLGEKRRKQELRKIEENIKNLLKTKKRTEVMIEKAQATSNKKAISDFHAFVDTTYRNNKNVATMVRILQKAVGKFAKSFPEEAKDAANKILEGRKQMFLEVDPNDGFRKVQAACEMITAIRDYVKLFSTGIPGRRARDLIYTCCILAGFHDLYELLKNDIGIDKDTKPDVNMYEHHQLKYDHTAFVMQDLHKYLDEGEEDRSAKIKKIATRFACLPFKPNIFQVEMLDEVLKGNSVIACAPTSYGKSFGMYYTAAYTVATQAKLHQKDGGSLVIICCPNQALLDQTHAEMYGRMRNLKIPDGQKLEGMYSTTFETTGWRHARVLMCDLVSLEKLLLDKSPEGTKLRKRIVYIVFDEFHVILERHARLMLLVTVPFLALSATIGNPKQLAQQLHSLQRAKGLRTKVLLIPRDGRQLPRPVDLLWWRLEPPPIEQKQQNVPLSYKYMRLEPDPLANRQMCATLYPTQNFEGYEWDAWFTAQVLEAEKAYTPPDADKLADKIETDTSVTQRWETPEDAPPAKLEALVKLLNGEHFVPLQVKQGSTVQVYAEDGSKKTRAAFVTKVNDDGTCDIQYLFEGLSKIKEDPRALVRQYQVVAKDGEGVQYQQIDGSEAITLWNAMPESAKTKLEPFKSAFPTKNDVRDRVQFVKDTFMNLSPADQAKSIAKLKATVIHKPVMPDTIQAEREHGVVFSGLLQMKKQLFFPAICFNHDRQVGLACLTSVVERLERAEARWKATDKAWQEKVERSKQKEVNRGGNAKKRGANNAAEAQEDGVGESTKLNVNKVMPEFSFAQGRESVLKLEVRPLLYNRAGATNNMKRDHILIRALRRGIGFHDFNWEASKYKIQIMTREINRLKAAGEDVAAAEMTQRLDDFKDVFAAFDGAEETNPNFMVVARYLKAVEDLFRKKAINVVFSTDSLSLGVNMPIHSVCFVGDSDKLNPTSAQQMSGRAGRRGLDLEGNVVSINISQERVTELMTAVVKPLNGGNPLEDTQFMRTLGHRGIAQEVEKWAKQSTFYTCKATEGEFPDDPLSPLPATPKTPTTTTPANEGNAAAAASAAAATTAIAGEAASAPAVTTAAPALPKPAATAAAAAPKNPEPKKELTEQEKKAAAMKARLAANQRAARGKKRRKKKKKK